MLRSVSLSTTNDENGSVQESYSTANSRLLPKTFELPQLKHGTLKIIEPHGRNRRPKSGDFKLLAAYVAGYVGSLIPEEVYRRFIDKRGEREWKRVLRTACDLEWRVGDVREFDDIDLSGYNAMRDYVARAWPFTTRYFDGAWLIKWALRTTWTNRKRAALRVEKLFEKQARVAAGLNVSSGDDMPVSSQHKRRTRASKLGESLYCVGGCQKMLTLKHFPENHTGICKGCTSTRRDMHISDPSQLHDELDCSRLDTDAAQTQFSQNSRSRRQFRKTVFASNSIPRLSEQRPRRNRHAALLSSVTAYSDAGEYPSGRSTYGVAKSSQKRLQHRHGPRFNRQNAPMQLPREKAVNKQLNEVEGLLQYLTGPELQNLQLRRNTGLQHTQPVEDATQDINSDVDSLSFNNTRVSESLPTYLTPNSKVCIRSICDTWNVVDITDVFPHDLWPKTGTLWRLNVLEVFLYLAQQYPTLNCRKGICNKFAELVRARRRRLNAKTQWTIVDANATKAWARQEYGTPEIGTPLAEEVDNNLTGVRLGYRKRIPSMKATLLQKGNKGKQNAVNSKFSHKLLQRNSKRTDSSTLSDLSDFSDLT